MKERVKALCKTKGVSMNTAESEMGLAKGYISKLGNSNPNTKTLQKLADYFGVTVEYLLTGEKSQPRTFQGTLAAHFDGDEFTEEELNDILNYIEFVRSRKNKK